VPDVSAVPVANSAGTGDPALCALAEPMAQCLAARNASIANLLVKESEAVAAQPGGCCRHSDGSELSAELLRLEATQKRNTAAADALTAFLRLVEAEGGATNLEQRGRELDAMLADVERVLERGLPAPVSKSELQGQRLDLWHRQVDVRATIEKLNVQLEDLLGVDLAPGAHFWPEAALRVSPDVPNPDEAVGFALANRADLAALRLAANADGAESLAAARTLLAIAGGGLGTAPPKPHAKFIALVHVHAAADEQQARSQQLAQLLAERQRATRHETWAAAAAVETHLAQIGLTRRRLQVAETYLQTMEQQQRLAEGGAWSVHKARLDRLAVEQDLLHDVIEWKLAVVQLKAAEGLLAIECGYDAIAHCSGDSCRR
jgi:hypothetical protein